MEKEQRNRRINIVDLSAWDFILAGLLCVFCFFSFGQNNDIIHTGTSSISILNGHIFDFYEANEAAGLPDGYMIPTYLLFAVWNIPVRILGICTAPTMEISQGLVWYFRLLPVLFYAGCGAVVYQIEKSLGFSGDKAKLGAYLFLFSPVAVYSQFIFGQYDAFTVFFMLLGILAYVKDDEKGFLFWFGISAVFKYFTLAFLVPLLILKEKNLFRAAGKTLLSMIPLALVVVPYWNSASFHEHVLGFSVLGSVLGNGEAAETAVFSLKTLIQSIPWNLVTAAGICLYCLFSKKADIRVTMQRGMFACSLMCAAVFGFLEWHPQWLLLCVPFWVLSMENHRFKKVLYLGDLVFMLFFVMCICTVWNRELDQDLLLNGIFRPLALGQIGEKLTISMLYGFTGRRWLELAVASGLFALALFRAPLFYQAEKTEEDIHKPNAADGCLIETEQTRKQQTVWPARIRTFVGTGLFVIPAMMCLQTACQSPFCTTSVSFLAGHLPGITPEFALSQTFEANSSEVEFIEFYTYDYDRSNTVTLRADLVSTDTNEVLRSYEWDTSAFPNRGWLTLDCHGLPFEEGHLYRVDFTCAEGTEENSVTFYQAGENTAAQTTYALLNGEKRDFSLCIKVFEKDRPE